MKSNYHSILFTTASLALGVGTASAANKYWSGTGNWSDSTWSTVSGGPYTTTWATYDEANFEGTAGTVTVTGTQTANRIFFTTNGYTLTGGTLGFGGPGGQGTVSVASGITGIIQSNINTGNDGIRKFGSGTLTLTGSTITNSAFTVLSGGTLAYEGVGTWSQNNDSYLGNSAGTGLSKLNLSSGTFSAAGRTICVGVRDSAELNISGPTTLVTAATITSLWQGDASAGCSATLNLDGGTLTTNAISRNSTIRNFTANLNGGLLKAGAAGTLLNANLSRVNVRDGGAKIDTNGFDPTVAAALQHSNVSGDNATDGGLTKTGNGTLTLSGANTYTGGTTINGGTLKLTGSVTSPLIVVGASGTLEGGTFGSGNTVSGTGTLTETVTIGAGATLAPAGDGSIGNLAVNGTLTLAGNTSIDVNKSGLTITSDHISGTGTVTAGGTLTLHTTGDPLVVGDVIQILDGVAVTSGSAFASVTVVPTLPAGTSIDTSNLAVNGTVQVVNRLASPSFSPASGGYVGAQSVTISSDSGTTIYYTVDGSDPTNSPTNGPSPVTLTVPTETYQYTVKAIAKKSGQGNSLVATAVYNTVTTPTWIANVDGHWSNAITYPEDKANWKNDVIAGGVGIAADFSTLELSQNITVTLDDSRTIGSMKFGDASATPQYDWALGGSSVLTLDGGASQPVIEVLNQTTTISTPLTGTQGLVKNGDGTLKLSGANTYGGITAVNKGSLITSGAAQPATVSIGQDAIYHPQSVNANVVVSGSGKWELTTDLGISWSTNADTSAYAGTTTIGSGLRYWAPSANSIPGGTIVVAAGGQLGLAGSQAVTGNYHIAGNSWAGHEVNGAIRLNPGNGSGGSVGGTVVLDAAAGIAAGASGGTGSVSANISGSYELTLMNGTITVSGANSFGSLNLPAGATAVAGSATAFGGGALIASGTARLNGNNLSIANLTGGGSVQNGHDTNASTLTVGSDSSSTSFTGVITDGGAGTLGITKTGSGTLTLSGANTYLGGTIVNAGTLELASSGSLSFKPAANGVSNRITGAGSVTLDGSFNLNLTAANLTPGNSWNLVDVATLNESYGASFNVVGFTGANHVWTKADGANVWTFTEATGNLTLSAAAGYSSWASANAGGQGPEFDFDGDGVKNGIEYFMGQTGSSFTAMPAPVTTAGVTTVTWTRDPAATVTSFGVQFSTTLGNDWAPVPAGEVNLSDPTKVIYTFPAPLTGKRFVRLSVTP